jgi:hypothetical protein
LQTPQGEAYIRGVLCVLTFVVSLMSESQVNECGGRVLTSKAQATVMSTEDSIILKGMLRDALNVLDFSITRYGSGTVIHQRGVTSDGDIIKKERNGSQSDA